MALTNYVVEPRKAGWAVLKQGSTRATNVYDKKTDAVARARELATKNRPAKVKIRNKTGAVQVRDFGTISERSTSRRRAPASPSRGTTGRRNTRKQTTATRKRPTRKTAGRKPNLVTRKTGTRTNGGRAAPKTRKTGGRSAVRRSGTR